MRVLFMGTGEIGEPALAWLLGSRHEVCGVVTQPDRPVGRHQVLTAPGPKVLAQEAGVPVLQPERVRDPVALAEMAALAPEVIVVIAYGQILPQTVLDLPTVACINVHGSLLPRHRGAACIQAAIAAGDVTSGVTVMHVTRELDSGDIILHREITLAPDETGGSLHDRLKELAPEALGRALDLLEKGAAPRIPQEEALSTYVPKLLREDGLLDWARPAGELERLIRAYHPWPGTFTRIRDGRGRERRLKIFPGTEVRAETGEPGVVLGAGGDGIVVACGSGALVLDVLQPEGGRRLSAAEFLAGNSLAPGDRLF